MMSLFRQESQAKMKKQKEQECQNIFPDEWFEDPFEIRFGTDLIR